MKQPVPKIVAEDVERVVRRDFPADEIVSVMQMLNKYGTESWHREIPRVQIASLKVANGDKQRLSACLKSAMKDYRNVLSAAEYPLYGKRGWTRQGLPEEERISIIESDWQQYDQWLRRPI